jgi:hypothetical protein
VDVVALQPRLVSHLSLVEETDFECVLGLPPSWICRATISLPMFQTSVEL